MDAETKKQETMLITAGMILMVLLTVIKIVTGSQIAASALIIAGIAFFFSAEWIAKTKDAESGLSFPRFVTDLRKPDVIPLIMFMIALTLVELVIAKLLFGNALAEHVTGRASFMTSTNVLAVVLNQVFVVLGEEIGFRGFLVGKGEKILSFRMAALVSAVLFAAAHYAPGNGIIVAWDLGEIFLDAILFAMLYQRSGNCLITCIPHFCGNMLGYILLPVLFA